MKRIIVVCGLLLCASAQATTMPLPQSQWTSAAHLWLARAMVAEAGWEAERDHVAIAYVLARRWRRISERYLTYTFVDLVRNYCAGLGEQVFTPRQRWLRGLTFLGVVPAGWPTAASWSRHHPLWRAALYRSDAWFRGMLSDPCRGKALHWGGTMDSPSDRMQKVDCGQTLNIFYEVTSTPRPLQGS